jgi:hypothetical protein
VQGAFGIATVDLIAGEATLPKRKEKDEATEAHVKLMSSSCQAHVKLMSIRLVAAKLGGRVEGQSNVVVYLLVGRYGEAGESNLGMMEGNQPIHLHLTLALAVTQHIDFNDIPSRRQIASI